MGDKEKESYEHCEECELSHRNGGSCMVNGDRIDAGMEPRFREERT